MQVDKTGLTISLGPVAYALHHLGMVGQLPFVGALQVGHGLQLQSLCRTLLQLYQYSCNPYAESCCNCIRTHLQSLCRTLLQL